ncbi:heterokaryon incompatibility protein-domain-containing protein [Immersiella caudata]|uniref:Heterokaryon incompatibility protein-domain-containing protein n=1 Tax=Immersiella caudata TaxID=314043 RepID=A0AA39WDD6_9PEZI|nr:heterokaryon incompatibility protein-domain-containing protein [Immersiella caudata]
MPPKPLANSCDKCRDLLLNYRTIGWRHERGFAEFLESLESCDICAFLRALFEDDAFERLPQDSPDVSRLLLRIFADTDWYRSGYSFEVVGRNNNIYIQEMGKTSADVVASFSFIEGDSALGKRPAWRKKRPLTLKDRVPQVKEWLSECESSHTLCRVTQKTSLLKPARLVDVGATGRQNLDVRLVLVREGFSSQYAALSHVWGVADIAVKTTLQKLQSYLVRIPYTELPPTFQDAVAMARALGIRYIWIDSLCIIQDSPPDWEEESSKMGATYQGAWVTLSTGTAESCQMKSNVRDILPCMQPFYFKKKSDDACDSQDNVVAMSFRPSRSVRPQDFNRYPIHSRGWVFQEKMLSRRILHMTNTELVWQCHTTGQTESHCPAPADSPGQKIPPLGPVFQMPEPPGQFSQSYTRDDRDYTFWRWNGGPGDGRWAFNFDLLWWTWVSQYTRRRLTLGKDVLPAFWGLTQHFQQLSNGTPILGLWADKLAQHLLWFLKVPSASEQPRTPVFPSWSWMSIPLPALVAHPFETSHEFNFPQRVLSLDMLVKDTAHQLQWSGVPGSSTLVTARLTLSGPVSNVRFLSKPREQVFTTPLSEWIFEITPTRSKWEPFLSCRITAPSFDHPLSGSVFFDRAQEVLAATSSAYRVVHVAKYMKQQNQDCFTYFLLIIKRTSPGGTEYHRVGVAVVEARERLWWGFGNRKVDVPDLPGVRETGIHLV